MKKYNLSWTCVQICYAIGKEKPLSINIESDKGNIIVDDSLYDRCTLRNIIHELDLLNKCYYETAMFGHFQN